ncbi:MAG: YXWGXW repeat-containing protein [Pseudomonadota bacterium]
MNKPSFYAAALLAISSAAFLPAQAMAQVDFNIVVGNAPPPPRFESVPVARRGHVWVPGYWNWDGNRHVWLGGHWEAERVGYQFRRAEWVRDRDGWRLDRGGWIVVNAQPVPVGYVNIAPPPPRHEIVPHPRPGYLWSPGYWEWRGHRHEWITGSWVRERPGYAYSQARWEQRDGRWVREEARWERHNGYRDRDHDGIPDHRDRDRDNDGIPNRRDHDRDGDGVPNRYDERPDNPRRR